MNHILKKSVLLSAGIFITMFIFRLIYGYISHGNYIKTEMLNNRSYADSDINFKVNIASKKFKIQTTEGRTRSVDQKYEKIASIESKSSELDTDEKKVRTLVEKSDSVIQYENTSGLKPDKNRIIELVIGVPPEKFDLFVEDLKNIGKVTSINIDKRDKTNEYKELKAKKESLIKIRSSLISLKNKGGKIDEYINLENRILEIEEKIQKLGLNLGEFDSENEFCTVKLKLTEVRTVKISFLHRIKVAFEWTVKYFLLLASGFGIFIFSLNSGFNLINKYKEQKQKKSSRNIRKK